MMGYVGSGRSWRITSVSSLCPLFAMQDGRTVRLEMYVAFVRFPARLQEFFIRAIGIHANVVTFQRLLMHVR